MQPNGKIRVRTDPLYMRMVSPDIFKSQDNPQLSRELLNAIVRISKDKTSADDTNAYSSDASKIDHKKITEKLTEIERLLEHSTKKLHTIKSSPVSESNYDFSDVLESCSDYHEDQPDIPHAKLQKYKVSLLQKGYHPESSKGKKTSSSGNIFHEFRKQMDELKAKDKETYNCLNLLVQKRFTIGDWKGKFAPQAKHVLEKMFTPHEHNYTTAIRKPHTKIPPAKVELTERVTTPNPNNTTFWIETHSNRQEYINDIIAAQRLKRLKKQNVPLELDKPNTCYSTNPNRFVQKRFKMNPRFTWLCKTGENRVEWINAIKLGIDQSNATNYGCNTKKKLNKPRYLHNCYSKNGYYKIINEQRPKSAVGFFAGKNIKPVNLSEIAKTPAYNSNIHRKESSPSRQKERPGRVLVLNKHKGFSSSGQKRKISFDFPIQVKLPEEVSWSPKTTKKRATFSGTARPFERKRGGFHKKENVVTDEIIEKLKKTKQPSNTMKARTEMPTANISALKNLLEMCNKKPKRIDSEVLKQQRLVRKRKVYKKHQITTGNNPIFNLSLATCNHRDYSMLQDVDEEESY